jgi:hypothetical protein
MRKSWMIMGGTAFAAGLIMILAIIFAVIAIPILIVGGLLLFLIALFVPGNRGYYFVYDSSKRKLVKKRV